MDEMLLEGLLSGKLNFCPIKSEVYTVYAESLSLFI